MSLWSCPGQDTRYWKPEDIFEEPCPHCGELVEFWKNDVKVRCPNCKKDAPNPKFDPGCAAWCSYAVQCLGPAALTYQRQPQVVRDRLNAEVRKALADRQEVLNRSLRTAAYAERIVKEEEGAEMLVVVAASLLQGLPAGGPGEGGQEDGTAEEIMSRLGLEKPVLEEVKEILAFLNDPGESGEKSRNLKIVGDAVVLADLEIKLKEGGQLPHLDEILPTLYTSAARDLVRPVILGGASTPAGRSGSTVKTA